MDWIKENGGKLIALATVICLVLLYWFILRLKTDIVVDEKPNVETANVDTTDFFDQISSNDEFQLEVMDMIRVQNERHEEARNELIKLANNRRANNDNVKDEDLLMSIEASLIYLESKGY